MFLLLRAPFTHQELLGTMYWLITNYLWSVKLAIVQIFLPEKIIFVSTSRSRLLRRYFNSTVTPACWTTRPAVYCRQLCEMGRKRWSSRSAAVGERNRTVLSWHVVKSQWRSFPWGSSRHTEQPFRKSWPDYLPTRPGSQCEWNLPTFVDNLPRIRAFSLCRNGQKCHE